MTRSRICLPVLTGVLLVGCAGRAEAGLVIWSFEGEIDGINDPTGFLDGIVTVGTPYSGTFTFESNTVDSNPSSTGGAYLDAVLDLSGSIDGVEFLSNDLGRINIANDLFNNLSGMLEDAFSLTIPVEFQSADLFFSLGLRDFSGAAIGLDSDSLPLVPPDLDNFTSVGISFSKQDDFNLVFGGGIDSLQVIPEPATIALLVLGAVAGLARRKRLRLSNKNKTTALHLLAVFLFVAAGEQTLEAQATDPCGCMDVVFVVDVTGSETNLALLRAELGKLVPTIAAAATDLRMGLIVFDDRIGVISSLIEIVDPNDNFIKTELETLGPLGGGALPEASDEALREMLRAADGSGTVCSRIPTLQGDFDVPFRAHCIKHVILV